MQEGKKQLEQNVREIIIRKHNSGKNPKKIAEELELNRKTVSSVIFNYKKTGRIFAKRIRTPKNKIIGESGRQLIILAIENDVSIPLKSLKIKLMEDLGIAASITTISKCLDELNYSFKRVVLIPEVRNSHELIENRFIYCSNYILYDENKIIFIDEFGISCSSRVGYGRSFVGTSPRKKVRAIRSRNISVCAAISKYNLLKFDLNPVAYNSETFKTFILNLIEGLRIQGTTNGMFIMDNASIHKRNDIRVILAENGFELIFLPPYTPQLNPIEEIFNMWKHNIKTMNPKTIEELNNAIFSASNLITSENCQSFYSHVRNFVLRGIRREDF